MKASLAEQKKLLDLHDIDTAVARFAHRQRNLPENAEIAAVTAERNEIRGRLATELGTLEDARTELSRIESDVAMVDARMKRDTDRLTSSSSVKDVAALESEIESLKARKNALEDAQLEVMERVDAAEKIVEATRGVEQGLTSRLDDLAERRSAALDEIANETASLTAQRGALQNSVAADLYALYEQRRAKGGTGAALFRAGTCGACTITLTGNDLQSVRSAEIDEVLQCPECSSIMVRTEESGLW
ncbi:C4-type zinc ribbon domain-containing protein [Okibacterium endophyticum]